MFGGPPSYLPCKSSEPAPHIQAVSSVSSGSQQKQGNLDMLCCCAAVELFTLYFRAAPSDEWLKPLLWASIGHVAGTKRAFLCLPAERP